MTCQSLDFTSRLLTKLTFKSTYQILKEISEVWDTMTDIDQAAALELMGGKRQANSLAAIISNFDTAIAARDTALSAEGSATRELDTYLDSVNGKVAKLQANFESLSTHALSSDVAKWFLDLASAITQSIDLLAEFSPGSLIGTIFGAVSSFKNAGFISTFNDPNRFSGKGFDTILSSFKSGASKREISQIETYNKLVTISASKGKEFAASLVEQNTRLGSYLSTLNGGAATVKDFANSLSKVSVVSKLAGVGMNLLATAGNMLITAVAGFAINKIIEGITWLATRQQQLMEEAQTFTSGYNESLSSIGDYESRVTQLQTSISSGTLSYEETKAARLELIDIQNQMIDQFGSEADSINLVTQAIQGQTDAWEGLRQQEYQNWLDEVEETGQLQKAQEYLERDNSVFFPTNVDRFFEDFEDHAIELSNFSQIVNEALMEMFPDDITWDGYTYKIQGTPEELADPTGIVYDVINARRELVDKLSQGRGFSSQEIAAINNEFEKGLTQDQGALEEISADYQELYNNYLAGQVQFSDDYSDAYKKLEQAKNDYNEALVSGNEGIIDAASLNVREAYENAIQAVELSDAPDSLKANLEYYFRDVFPEVAELEKWWNFDDLLNEVFDNVKGFTAEENIQDWFEEFDQVDLYEALFKDAEDGVFGNATDEVGKIFSALAKQAEELGIISDATDSTQLKQFIDLLVEMGYVSGTTAGAADKISSSFQDIASSAEAAQAEVETLTEVLNAQDAGHGISLDNYNALIAANADYADALEYSNGVMKINADRAKEIAQQDVSAQITKATTQMKMQAQELRNTESALTEYRSQLQNLYNQQAAGVSVSQEQISTLEQTIASYESTSDAIQGNINKYAVLISNLREAAGAYAEWQNAQDASESGDMYDDTHLALQDIEEGLESGKVGRKDFKAAVDFLIPDDVSRDNMEAIEDYKENVLDRYITFDEDEGEMTARGVANFLDDAMDKGLAEVDDDGNWKVTAGTLMEDFAEELHLTPEMVRAIFGELEEYGFEFDWSDEFEKSMELTEEEVVKYKDQINAELSKIGTDPIDIKMNVSQIVQGEADLFDLGHYEEYGGTVDMPVNVKAHLQVQEDMNSVQEEIDNYTAQLDTDGNGIISEEEIQVNVDAYANLTEAQTELAVLKARLSEFETPTQVEIELATAAIDEQIADLQTQLQLLEQNPPTIETENGIEIDTTSYNEQVSTINAQISALNETKATITGDLNKDEFDSNASAVETKVEELSGMTATPSVRLEGHSLAIANINSVAAALGGLPTSKTVTIYQNTVRSTATTSNAGPAALKELEGSGRALGTAINGFAYANGKWGISKGQKALVGELGRELVVDPYTGRWHTVGDLGAELVDLPKGAIVFNHEQTEQILEKGYVHGRGTALVNGNAYVTGGGNLGNIQVGIGVTNWDTGYVPWTDPDYATSTNNATSATNDFAQSVNNASSAVSDASDEVEEYVSDLWELYEVEKKLQDVQDYSSILEIQLDMAESANEAIGIQEKLVDAYQAEQEAYHNLAEERRKLIQEKIPELEAQGFIIDYDPVMNDLFIENTEHVNDLIGDTTEETNELRKEAEETLNTIIDWNDANQEAGESWWQLAQSIQDTREELADNAITIFDDFIEYMDAFELWANSNEDRVDLLIKKQNELNRLYEQGYLTIQQYQDLTLDTQQEIYEERRDAITEIIDLTEQMIKQEVEDQIEAIEEQIEAYRELINLRKEALEQNREEADHQDQVNEKVKELAEMRAQINRLNLAAQSGDRAAAAEKASLEEDYAELQKELADYQTQYSYETQQEALDKEMELFEKQKNEEIEALRESIETERKLYEAAIARINEGWDALYNDLLAYSHEYQDAISGEDSLKTSWEIATDAVKDYAYNVEVALDAIKGMGSMSSVTNDRVGTIIDEMKANGRGWASATTDEERAHYEAANETLAKQLSAVIGRPVVKGYDGVWYLDKVGGTQLYDVYKGTSEQTPSAPSQGQVEQENQTEVQVRSLVTSMRNNGTKYANATSDAEREHWAAANRQIASQVSALLKRPVVIGEDGVWYLDRVGGRRLYDVYHKGGIVGGKGTTKSNEVFSLLEKDEMVLNDQQQKSLFKLVDISKAAAQLFDRLNQPLVLPGNNSGGGDVYNVEANATIQVDGSLDAKSAKKYGEMAADIALKKITSGFSKFGIVPGKAAYGIN